MKIFISWSGDRGKAAAMALREWLPLVLHYAEPWLSDRDIAAGDRWATEIGRELEVSHFGIIVLTPDSLNAPWILFEAGALSKAFTAAAVCPLLIELDFKDISGPLSQFQAKKSDQESVLSLVRAINGKAAAPVDTARLAALFDMAWPKLETALRSLPPARVPGPKPRPEGDVLEELVATVREELRAQARSFELLAFTLQSRGGLNPLSSSETARSERRSGRGNRSISVDCVQLHPEPLYEVRVRFDDDSTTSLASGPEPTIRMILDDDYGLNESQINSVLRSARARVRSAEPQEAGPQRKPGPDGREG